jgi:hypothetical protein
LSLLSFKFATPTYGFAALSRLLVRGLLIGHASPDLAKMALTLKLSLENTQGLIDVVIPNQNFQRMFLPTVM